MIQPDRKEFYSSCFADVWNLFKKYYDPPETIELAKKLQEIVLDDMEAISDRHGKDKLCSDLVVDTTSAIFRHWQNVYTQEAKQNSESKKEV